MNGVIGMTSLLQTTELTEEQLLYVDVIEKSSNNLLEMMNQILDYSKMEAGTMKLEQSPFHIRDAVDHILQLFAADAEKKGSGCMPCMIVRTARCCWATVRRFHKSLPTW